MNSLSALLESRRNLHLPPDKLEELRLDKLRRILVHAYQRTAFYRRLFDQARVHPDRVRNFDDFLRFPIVDRVDLQAASLSDRLTAGLSAERLIRIQTSGSTGIPFVVYKTPSENRQRYAVFSRILLENGYSVRNRILTIWRESVSPRQKWFQRMGFIRVRRVSIFEPVAAWADAINDYRPDVLYTTGSSARMLAEYLQDTGRTVIRPKMVIPSGDMVDAATRARITKVFGVAPLDLYGSNENGSLGWQCSERSGWHLNVDAVHIEILREDGSPAPPGEEGAVVCTNLNDVAMPLIRYRLGDIAAAAAEPCRCGRPLPLLQQLRGRQDDILTLPNGRRVTYHNFQAMMIDITSVRRYQVVQDAAGRIRVLVQLWDRERDVLIAETIRDRVESGLRRLCPGITVTLEIREQIPLEPSGKIRFVVSHSETTGPKPGR